MASAIIRPPSQNFQAEVVARTFCYGYTLIVSKRVHSMIHDHRPYWLKRWFGKFEGWYSSHFVAPGFESLGSDSALMKPWNVRLHGQHIRAGNFLHIIGDRHRKVSFSSWTFEEHQGHITLGDYVLVCPGCRLDSASSITIGDNCMLAAGVYITDADWHDIYDRTRIVGISKPVVLEDNVWIGDGSIICKGVTLGKNSVIGAGSVVASDIPENVIAVGNPATVIRPLDTERTLITRENLFNDPSLNSRVDNINRQLLHRNTLFGWLRTLLFPKRGD